MKSAALFIAHTHELISIRVNFASIHEKKSNGCYWEAADNKRPVYTQLD